MPDALRFAPRKPLTVIFRGKNRNPLGRDRLAVADVRA